MHAEDAVLHVLLVVVVVNAVDAGHVDTPQLVGLVVVLRDRGDVDAALDGVGVAEVAPALLEAMGMPSPEGE